MRQEFAQELFRVGNLLSGSSLLGNTFATSYYLENIFLVKSSWNCSDYLRSPFPHWTHDRGSRLENRGFSLRPSYDSVPGLD